MEIVDEMVERVAKIMAQMLGSHPERWRQFEPVAERVIEATNETVKEEREACAKVAHSFYEGIAAGDDHYDQGRVECALDIENEIRARSALATGKGK